MQVADLIHISEDRLSNFGYGLINSINPLHYMKGHKNVNDLSTNSLEILHSIIDNKSPNEDVVNRFKENLSHDEKFNDVYTKAGRYTGLGGVGAISIGATANKIKQDKQHEEEHSQMQNPNDTAKLALGSAAVAGTAYGLHKLINRREKQNDNQSSK